MPLRGKMESQAYLSESLIASSSWILRRAKDQAKRPNSGIAPALTLLVLTLISGKLVAQQPFPPGPSPYGQGWTQNDPYAGQYAPVQQPRYAQPQYTPPQPYEQQQQYSQQPYPDPGEQYPQPQYGTGQPSAQALGTIQLEQLVAPIALYPDTLVAQVLAAATYPAQVVDADHWRQAQGYAPTDQIAAGADVQNWDPSVKALTAFPQVLAEMDQNLRWTIALGNAYYNQPQDVLDVVQVMRQRAEAAGNLQSTPQESVNYDQGYIQLAPVNPQIVYLPAYDPWTVYGQPIQPYRGFSLAGALGSFFGSSPVRFGLGIAMQAFSHTSFGWLGWGLDWLTHSLLFQNSNYYSHSTTVADWGLPHGGPRAAFQHGTLASRIPNNSYRSQAPPNYGRSGEYTHGYGPYNGYNRTPGPSYTRPEDRNSENRSAPSYSRSNPPPTAGYTRPPMMAYNRIEQQAVRPQAYGGSFYGNGLRNAPLGGYGGRPNPVYNRPQQAYRAPISGFQQRGEFREPSSGASVGRGFEGYSGKPTKSGGFHPFGGEHEPKYSKGEGKPSRGHSEKGGHSGGFFGGKHHR